MILKCSLYVVRQNKESGSEGAVVHHLFGMIQVCFWYKGAEGAGAGHRLFASYF